VGFTETVRFLGVVPVVGDTWSQVAPEVETLNDVPDGSELTVMVFDPGAVPPLWAVKDRLAGLATSAPDPGEEDKVKDTGTSTGSPLDGVSVIFPWYVPAANDVGLIETVKFAGVVPLPGATVNQLPPLVETLKLTPAGEDVTFRVCDAGADPPAWPVNDRLVGLGTRAPGVVGAVNVSVTLTSTGVPPDGVSVTLLVDVPADSPAVFTDTVTVPGVVDDGGVAWSHAAPTVAVKLTFDRSALTFSVWDAGGVPPTWPVNVRLPGVTDNVGVDGVPTVRCTAMLIGEAFVAEMVMVPLYVPADRDAALMNGKKTVGVETAVVGSTVNQVWFDDAVSPTATPPVDVIFSCGKEWVWPGSTFADKDVWSETSVTAKAMADKEKDRRRRQKSRLRRNTTMHPKTNVNATTYTRYAAAC
jgi:hypothetical protein